MIVRPGDIIEWRPNISKQQLEGYAVTRRLDRAAIEEHRKRLGIKFDTTGALRGPNQWVHWDSVNSFARKIGDSNPLWVDEDYARKSCYGTVVAPPSFAMSVWRGQAVHGLPGVHAMIAGNEYEFLLPLLDGDKVTVECVFAEIEEKNTKFQDLWFIEYYDNTFVNQEGHIFIKQRCGQMRLDRGGAEEGYSRSQGVKKRQFPHPWTEEEVTRIEDEQLNRKVQGATPLYFEDVAVGDKLPDLVRGPFSITDVVAQLASHDVVMGGPAGLAFHARRHKGLSFFHPLSRAHEHINIIHWDKFIADATGYPHPHDFGHSRQTWQMTAITDWMGDHGWLKKNSARYRKLVVLGDVVRVKSVVAAKYVDTDGEPCVDIEHHSMNQREEDVMPGRSTVALPSKETGYRPVSSRLARRGRLPGDCARR